MSRRPVSPLRTITRTESDPRDQIIRKLKDELILARGREKELALMDNYLLELKEKTKLMEAEKVVHLVSRLRLMKRGGLNSSFRSRPSTNSSDRSKRFAMNFAVSPTSSVQSRKNRIRSRSI